MTSQNTSIAAKTIFIFTGGVKILFKFVYGLLFSIMGLSGVLAGFTSALDGYWERDSMMCVLGIMVGMMFAYMGYWGFSYLRDLLIWYMETASPEVEE